MKKAFSFFEKKEVLFIKLSLLNVLKIMIEELNLLNLVKNLRLNY